MERVIQVYYYVSLDMSTVRLTKVGTVMITPYLRAYRTFSTQSANACAPHPIGIVVM